MAVSRELTNAYRHQRERLRKATIAATAQAFQLHQNDQSQGVPAMLALVTAGQAQTVRLTDGFMALATGQPTQGLDPDKYTVATLRRGSAGEVYAQPYVAATVRAMAGDPAPAQMASGVARVVKIASTDLQLAQTHSARDWMDSEPYVTGWTRVGGTCALCQAAGGQIYHTGDLMPIHEHCGCVAVPVTESNPRYSAINANVRVVDSSIGPRLLADDWADPEE